MSAAALLSARAVREHCREVFEFVRADHSPHWRWREERLSTTSEFVADVIRQRYPDLKVPFHSRWRHIEAGGIDRWTALANQHHLDATEAVRSMIDLVIPSVLLDAGAGAKWCFVERESGQRFTRSEGLGVASVALFASGVLSDKPDAPLRADGAALMRVRPEHIHQFFQVDDETNPLIGLEGRAHLIRSLGKAALSDAVVFGPEGRLGNLFDHCARHAVGGEIRAAFVLETLLHTLGSVWPGRESLDGVSLGDCWPHPAASGGRVPFHKLTQWLTYSLLEPLIAGGLNVTDLDELTGLPEYRNGGLLIDTGLLEARDANLPSRPLTAAAPEVVEWRAVTVIALDLIAERVRAGLGVSAAEFPLARVLEGGTWAAGRAIAAQKREGGTAPLNIESDGTVF